MWFHGRTVYYYIDLYGLVWRMTPQGEAYICLADADTIYNNSQPVDEPKWGETCLLRRAQMIVLRDVIKLKDGAHAQTANA